MAPIPLAVAYMAIPLGEVLVRYMGPGPATSPFLPWLLLAGLGAIWAMLFRRSGVPVKKRFYFEVAMFLTLGTMLFFKRETFLDQMEFALPLLVEMAPVGILGFCLMWTMTFGVPDRAAFQRYGAFLAVLCIVDLAVETVAYQGIPVVRWLGNSDMLAGLLLISLCASLRPGENDGGTFEPDQGNRAWRVLILMGLVACLSRTGLFGAGWIFLCFGRGSRLLRILVSLCFFLLIGLTLLLPYSQSGGVYFIDYWLWAKSVALFSQDPTLLLTGLPMDRVLPYDIPAELVSIWEKTMDSPALLGVHLPQVNAFWLRILIGWGAIIPLALLGLLFFLLSRRVTRMGAGLTAALFAQGMSTPLLYAPAIGAPLGLALFLALSRTTPLPNVKTGPGSTTTTTDNQTDPVREWDMRPL